MHRVNTITLAWDAFCPALTLCVLTHSLTQPPTHPLTRDRDEGRINVRTRWKEYGPSVEEEEAYVAVKKNTSGSRPKELFEDLIVVGGALWG